MKRIFIIGALLIALSTSACNVLQGGPANNPTPTKTSAPPTVPPTPTAVPTATQPPATATAASSANPLDALRKVFSGWGSVKSFRAKFTRTSGTTTSDGTLEVVLPDHFHFISKQSEVIVIGKTFYIKTGTQWQKVALTQGFDFSFADVKKLQEELGVATEVKFIGPDVLDGAPMLVYQYTSTYKGPPAITTTSKVWVAVSDSLPRKSETTGSTGAKTVTTFYDYNANIAINPPIP